VRTQVSNSLTILSEIRNQRIAIASTFEAPLTRIATVLVSEKRTILVRISKPHFALDFTFSALAGEAFCGIFGGRKAILG